MKLVLLGSSILAATVLILVATVVASSRTLDDVATAAPTATVDHAAMGMSGTATGKGTSYAGVAPPNAKELAAAHVPYSATLPPTTPGSVLKVHMVLKDVTMTKKVKTRRQRAV